MPAPQLRAKLQAMQQPDPAREPSPNPPSFAGLLAALAAPAGKKPDLWNDDDLADDVATLSYEHALHTHARYHAASASPTDQSLTGLSTPQLEPEETSAPAHFPIDRPTPGEEDFSAVPQAVSQPRANMRPQAPHFSLARDLKSSSITIRLSEAECAQLRQRAAEAGLTVSAYLRSCTFEAERLRALVRDTMAQLRAATSTAAQPAAPRGSRLPKSWLFRLSEWLATLAGGPKNRARS